MRSALVIAANDLRRRVRDRSLIFQGVVGPSVLAVIISLAFGGLGGIEVTVAVVDLDGSSESQAAVDQLTTEVAGSGLSIVELRTRDALVQAIGDDDPAAGFVIPAGWAASIPTEPLPLEVLSDRNAVFARAVAGGLARGLTDQVDLRRVAVEASLRSAAQVDPDTGATAVPPDLDGLLADVETLEPAIASAQVQPGVDYSAASYFAPGMAILFLFFAMGSAARSLITDERDGILARVRAAPVTPAALLGGKTVGVLATGLVSMLTVWAFTSLSPLGADWGPPLAVMAVIASVVLAVGGLSTLVAVISKTEPQADGYTTLLAFLTALLGGTFITPGSLPDGLQSIAQFTPNGQALRAFTDLQLSGVGLGGVLAPVATLLAIGLVSGGTGLALARRRFTS